MAGVSLITGLDFPLEHGAGMWGWNNGVERGTGTYVGVNVVMHRRNCHVDASNSWIGFFTPMWD